MPPLRSHTSSSLPSNPRDIFRHLTTKSRLHATPSISNSSSVINHTSTNKSKPISSASSNLSSDLFNKSPSTMPSSSLPTSTPFLLLFYDPSTHAPDHANRTLPKILSLNNTYLERSHDYIQLLFPLPEPSPFNPNAPTITQEIALAFRSSPALRQELYKSFLRMLSFYNLEGYTESHEGDTSTAIPTSASVSAIAISPAHTDAVPTSLKYTIRRTSTFRPNHSPLLARFDHNHLRITRIIRSLRVLGCGAVAEAFWRALRDLYEAFPRRTGLRTMMFWSRAARRDIWVPPEWDDSDDDGEDDRKGVKWLRELDGFGDRVTEEIEGWEIVWDEERGEVGFDRKEGLEL